MTDGRRRTPAFGQQIPIQTVRMNVAFAAITLRKHAAPSLKFLIVATFTAQFALPPVITMHPAIPISMNYPKC
jgi:hypothetical protein